MSKIQQLRGETQSGDSATRNFIVWEVGNIDRAKVAALSAADQVVTDTASGSILVISPRETEAKHVGTDKYEVSVRYKAQSTSNPAREKYSKLYRSWSSADESANIKCPLATTLQVGATAPHATIGPNDEGASVDRGFITTDMLFVVPRPTDAQVATYLAAYNKKVNSTTIFGMGSGSVKFDGFTLSPMAPEGDDDGGLWMLSMKFAIRPATTETIGALSLLKDGWDIASVKTDVQIVAAAGQDSTQAPRAVPVSAASVQVFERADLNAMITYWTANSLRHS